MEDSIKTMSDTVTKLTKMMEIMAETRNKDREDYEKELVQRDKEREENQKVIHELLRKVGTATAGGSTMVTAHAGPSIDALESRIVEFQYDEEDCWFEQWYSRYKYVFENEAKDMDDDKKVLMLMRHVSLKVSSVYEDHISPSSITEKKFDETILILTKLFGRRVSEFEWRLKFLKLSMTGEGIHDVKQYASQVNNCYQKGALKGITEEQLKVTVFLAGLDASNMRNVRMQLLTLVNSKADITLNEVVEKYSTMVALERDAGAVAQGTKVQALYHERKKMHPAGSGKKQVEKNTKRCYHCEKDGHFKDECWVLHPELRPSGKKGKKYKSKNLRMLECNRLSDRIYRDVLIDGKNVRFLIDTGADVSVISRETWHRIGSPVLAAARKQPRCANDTPLEIMGEVRCKIELESKSVDGILYVAETTTNLLGIDLFWQLRVHETLDNGPDDVVYHVKVENYEKMMVEKFPQICESGLGKYSKGKAQLELKPGVRPIFRSKRTVPFASVEIFEREIERLLSMGVITKVDHSEWASPVVMLKKSNGKTRLCVDFSCGLNAALEDCAHPLPLPENIFSSLNGGTVFTTIDLSDAYLQVEMEEESKKLLVMNTSKGLFRYERLPFGVKTAPGIFQRIMDQMVSGLKGTFAYLDDIVVTGSTVQEHDANLMALLERIRDYGFRIRPEKCTFGKESIKYLGFIVDRKGRRPDPSKIDVIKSMPVPKDSAQLRSFLGSINYYSAYMKVLATKRVPLERLLKKDEKFCWTSECQKAFEKIKEVMSSDWILTHFDPSLPIIVAADASQYGIGGCLTHRMRDGSEKVVMNFSKSLSATEQKYGQIEKEGLALVTAVKKFHKFIYGRAFLLETDHKPLLAVFGNKKGIPAHSANRLQRWALILLAYDFKISYVKTDDFGKVDVLSRLISEYPREDEDRVIAVVRSEEDTVYSLKSSVMSLPVTVNEIKKSIVLDETLMKVKKYHESKWPDSKKVDSEILPYYRKRESISVVDDCLMLEERVIIPTNLRRRVMKEFHRGHPGIVRMKSIARMYAYWPGMDAEVENSVKACEGCASAAKYSQKAPLQPWIPTVRSFERIHIDFAGPCSGQYYLIVVDSYSKWPEVFVMERITTTATVNKLKEIFTRFGAPEKLVSDNGTQFVSRVFEEYCEVNGITHILTPPYHPQSNGQAERFVDIFKRAMLKMQGEGVVVDVIQKFLFSYRTTPNAQINGKTPAELFLGRKLRSRLDLMVPVKKESRSSPVSDAMKNQYDQKHGVKRREFHVGDSVYYADRDGPNNEKWVKATVKGCIGGVMYLIEKENGRCVRAHVNQLRERQIEKFEEDTEMQWSILSDAFGIERTVAAGEPRAEKEDVLEPKQTQPQMSPSRAPQSTSDMPPSSSIPEDRKTTVDKPPSSPKQIVKTKQKKVYPPASRHSTRPHKTPDRFS